MVIVRLLLFLALATIAVALLLYVFKRDRRYLRFIGQVIKFTLLVLVGVLCSSPRSGFSARSWRRSFDAAGPCRPSSRSAGRSAPRPPRPAVERMPQRPIRQPRRQVEYR